MIDAGYRVLFTQLPTSSSNSRRHVNLKLAAAIEKLDKHQPLILYDLSYVQ